MSGKNNKDIVKNQPIRVPTIGLQVLDLQLDYSIGLAKGMAESLNEQGANLAIFPVEQPKAAYGASDTPSMVQDLLRHSPVDALVLVTSSLVNFLSFNHFLRSLKTLNSLPILSIGVELQDYPSIINDNKNGLVDAITHLIDFHKLDRIAFVRGPLMHPEAEERYEAYLSCLAAHDIPVNMNYVCEGNFTYEAGVRAALKLLEETDSRVQAVVCANDDMAIGVLQTFLKKGINVPADIAIVGYDNVKEAAFCNPPMSSVDQPVHDIGKKAGDLALNLSRGEDVDHVTVVPTKFVIRNSCGCGARVCHITEAKEALTQLDPKEKKHSLIREQIRIVCMEPIDAHTQELIAAWFSSIPFDNSHIDEIVDMFSETLNALDVPSEFSQTFSDNVKIICSIAQNYLSAEHAQSLYYALSFVTANYFFSMSVQTDLTTDNHFLHMRNLLSFAAKSSSTHDFYLVFFEVLKAIDMRFFYIVLYQADEETNDPLRSGKLKGAETVFIYREGSDELVEGRFAHPTNELFYQDSEPVSGEAFIVEPLIYLGKKFGHICYWWDKHDRYTRMLFSALISSKLRADGLWDNYVDLEKRMAKLVEDKQNGEGGASSQFTDKLTGLLNHRGFYRSATRYVEHFRVAHKVLPLVYVKISNFGDMQNELGEDYINIFVSFISESLLGIFDEDSIMSRIKPEMFVILAPGYNDSKINELLDVLRERLNQYNDEAEKAFELQFESAINRIHPDSHRSFVDYVGDAEYLLARDSSVTH